MRVMLWEVMTIMSYHTTQPGTDLSCTAATVCGAHQSFPHHGLLSQREQRSCTGGCLQVTDASLAAGRCCSTGSSMLMPAEARHL